MTLRDVGHLQVSVILRTLNEAHYLPATLASIRAQQYPGKLECIVIDSGSKDDTVDVARRWNCDKILTIPRAEFSFGRALNRAIQQSTGDILVTLSAHAHPSHERWLEHLLCPFKEPRVGAVYGRQLPQPGAWPPVVGDYRRCYGEEHLIHTNVEGVFFSHANAALRRALWQQLRFDETMPACEDQAWARRIVELGCWVVYEPRAAVYHSHNEPPWQVYRRQAREEKGRRQLLPTRKATVKDFWTDWYAASREDASYILRHRRQWLWLILSPHNRVYWALGRWYPYV